MKYRPNHGWTVFSLRSRWVFLCVLLGITGCKPTFSRASLNEADFASYFFGKHPYRSLHFVMNNAMGGYATVARVEMDAKECQLILARAPTRTYYFPDSEQSLMQRKLIENRLRSASVEGGIPAWWDFPYSRHLTIGTLKTDDEEKAYYWDEERNVLYLLALGQKLKIPDGG